MLEKLTHPRFPKSSKYNPEWVAANVSGGANSLWLTEWLGEALNLKQGMKVLDVGCGSAMSSIFLHREFGVQVWACDLTFSTDQNLQRIRDARADAHVFPLHADARSLPFAAEFFDAIISIDSYMYYGTDDFMLNTVARFLKPGGQIGFAQAGMMQEIHKTLPAHLVRWWTPDLWCLHTINWWKNHWEKTGIVDIEVADTLEDGWKFWNDWHLVVAPDNKAELDSLNEDKGKYLGYVRLVARRKQGVQIEAPPLSLPTEYTRKEIEIS